MDAAALEQILDKACQDSRLCFQIVRQNSYLYIYINREEEAPLDLDTIAVTIHQEIASLQLSGVEFLALYSRIMGNTDPDWEQEIALKTLPDAASDRDFEARDEVSITLGQKSILNSVEAIVPEPEPEALDLAQYCFVRNKLFLTSDMNVAPEPVARAILAFHDLTRAQKNLALPCLEAYLKNAVIPPSESLPMELQTWFQSILALSEDLPRKFKIWMSRYCYDPEKAIAELEIILKPQAPTPIEPTVETRPSVTASVASQTSYPTTEAKAPENQSARVGGSKVSNSQLLESLIIAIGLAMIVAIIGGVAGWPGAIIHSLVVAQVTMTLLFKPFFGDFSGFMACVVFYITPDWISALQGKYWQDLLHSAKLFLWITCGVVPAWVAYGLLVGSSAN
ncbi:MAG: hypothetical protein AAFY11_04675 [Cyanobacteria bacterium J06641_5]